MAGYGWVLYIANQTCVGEFVRFETAVRYVVSLCTGFLREEVENIFDYMSRYGSAPASVV